jgi:hypothetical protein
MASNTPQPGHNQYGLKDASGTLGETRANRPGGERPGHGPVDAVDPSGHRLGAVEPHQSPKPASRQGTGVTGETDDKRR